MGKGSSNHDGPILAAGGIVVGEGANQGKIALVRRNRYRGEIGLPKGKVKGGEDAAAAALREVREETGYTTEITQFAGSTHYRVGKQPKIVSYFVMKPVSSEPGAIDAEEVASVEWVTPAEAVVLLTYPDDRDLIAAVFGLTRK